MNQRWYFSPYMGINQPIRMTPFMRNNMGRTGLLQRFSNIMHSVNWKNLLTSTNKTLNVINQTIPLIRQTGPMVNNMRSMLRLAKAFRKETKITNNKFNKQDNVIMNKKNITYTPNNNDDYPVFFI